MAESAGEAAQEGQCVHKDKKKTYSPEEEKRLERQHFWRIIDAFRFYRFEPPSLDKPDSAGFRQMNRVFANIKSHTGFYLIFFILWP